LLLLFVALYFRRFHIISLLGGVDAAQFRDLVEDNALKMLLDGDDDFRCTMLEIVE